MTTGPSWWSKVAGLPRRGLMSAVRGYRYAISPSLGSSCRFEPSCSAYALEALSRHGALVGTTFAVGRVLRCHPGCAGGRDDVPASGSGWLTGLLIRTERRSERPDRLHSLPDSIPEKNLP